MTASGPTRAYSVKQIANYMRFVEGSGVQLARSDRPITVNLSGLSAKRAQLARLALAAWADISGLTFKATKGAARITFDDTQEGAYAQWRAEGGYITWGAVNVEASWTDGDSAIDSYTLQTFVHEIGHVLGLGHAGPYRGAATRREDALYTNDSWQMTVMSYFSQSEAGQGSYRYVFTPMMADIYAIRGMYGATSVHAGNTVYGFDATVAGTAGLLYDFDTFEEAPAFTIYDTGGQDTINASRYVENQKINLNGGKFSNIGGLERNISIFPGTVVENAIGGQGRDTIWGNAGANTIRGGAGADLIRGGGGDDRLFGDAGNDRLYGGDGNDRLFGGPGNDRLWGDAGADLLSGGRGQDIFVYTSVSDSTPSGRDTLTDFSAAERDRIDLSAIDADITTPRVHDAFVYVGRSAFSGTAGELRLAGRTLQGDVNGDRRADLSIALQDATGFSRGNLIL